MSFINVIVLAFLAAPFLVAVYLHQSSADMALLLIRLQHVDLQLNLINSEWDFKPIEVGLVIVFKLKFRACLEKLLVLCWHI